MSRSHRRCGRDRRNCQHFQLEPLEDRHLLTVFTVANLSDGPVNAPGDLPGSLRQAIFDAERNSGADEIVFQAGVTGTIYLVSDELEITEDLTITGPGAASMTINAQNESRVFLINDYASQLFDVTLKGLTITRAGSESASGAVLSAENLTINESVVTGNHIGGSIPLGP